MRQSFPCPTLFAVLFALLSFNLTVTAQQKPRNLSSLLSVHPHDRITRPIDDRVTTPLTGNIHPMARRAYDTGRALPGQRMDRMLLVLEPEAAQTEALEAFIEEQQKPESPYYHQWLTPEEFGQRFGTSEGDISRVVEWLQTHGFEVEPVAAGGRLIVFSGSVAQVESAFQTEMHAYQVNGELHHANSTNPAIPEALASVVHGIVSLHDFRSQPQHIIHGAVSTPEYTGGSVHYMAPADLATIYDLNALYSASIDGAGQAIAVVGRTNIKLSDVASFRSQFGLPTNAPTVLLNGADPGIVSSDEQGEATLDVEWAGAVARKAAVTLVVSASTNASDGVSLSAQYAVNHNVAPVVTMSFGSCEAAMGSTENKFWNSLWQQAAAQGISVMVSSGDSGAAGCNSASASTGSGTGVNGLCSSPYSTCVGGTQFQDTTNPAQYWATSNGTGYSSALSYIPEAAWNESAAGGLWSTGGGASIVYSKPSWQAGTGVPADGHRDVPDVSLTAAGHDGYLIYMNSGTWVVAGTSAAAPSLAGVMALTNQKTGARLGNINPSLYALATKQAAGGAAVFHDVTAGNNTVPGVSGFAAGAGYDLATGLGSVDGFVMANHWSDASVTSPSFRLAASATSVSVPKGGAATVTLTASASGGFTSVVALTAAGLPTGLTATFAPASLTGGAGSSTMTLNATTQAAAGTYTVTASGAGGNLTQNVSIAVTIPSACTYSISPTSASATAAAGSYTVQVTAATGCAWTGASNSSWIAVSSGASGSGNGTLTYAVTANTATAQRSGTLTIAGLTLTVTQAVPTAGFTLSPTSASVGATASTGTVTVTASSTTSSWTAVSNTSWITITAGASGTGSKSVSYSVAANTATAARTGTMTIAGVTFTVTQAANPCSYAINPTSAAVPAVAGSYTAQVTTASGCTWAVASNSQWMTVTSGASGSGNGTVTYTVAANTSTAARTGALSTAQLNLTVAQAAASFSLSPASASFTAAAASGSVAVTAPSTTSTWTAVSNTSWITVTSGAASTGSKSVGYSVAANGAATTRSGTITIAGLTFTVTQTASSAVTPVFSLSASSASFSSAAGSGSVTVTSSSSGASWTAVSNASWIAITAGASGTGSRSVNYTVAANTAATRTGTLTLAGLTYTVTQTGLSCTYGLGSMGVTSQSSGFLVSFPVTAQAGCGWTASSDASWFTLVSPVPSGSGSGIASFQATVNTTGAPRSTKLNIAGYILTLTQSK